MRKWYYLIIILFISLSCNKGKVQYKSKTASFSFPSFLQLHPHFDVVDFLDVSATAIDSQNNVYLFLTFKGIVDGIATEGNDLVILKFKSDGSLIWKKHLNSSLSEINNSDKDEFSLSLLVDKQGSSVYFSARTKSSYIETNLGTDTSDIVIGKLNLNGNIQWLKHLGATTQEALKASLSNPDLNFSLEDQPGQMKQASSGELIMPFQTQEGSLFELSAGGWDVGIIKIDHINGNIVQGRQLGATSLAAYAATHSIATMGGAGNQRAGEAPNVDFDGSKIVMPFYTSDSLVETNGGATTTDATYVVYSHDLSIEKIIQLGLETYTSWKSNGNYNGSSAGGEQFRSVLVLSEGEYLFYGKIDNGSLAEAQNGSSDLIFARYQNHQLVKLVQLGLNSLPKGMFSEQARSMMRDKDGNIFCLGHTQSSLYDNVRKWSPFVLNIDKDGNVLKGFQFGVNTAEEFGMDPINNLFISHSEFFIKNGNVVVGIKHDPTSGGANLKQSFLWTIPFKNKNQNLIACPTGFIPVPHDSTTGTSSDFCVMKYEAKNDGNNFAISQTNGAPWVNVNIGTAHSKCTDLNALNGVEDKYDLISNQEWMTIARNAESVSNNFQAGIMARGWGANTLYGDTWVNSSVAPSTDANCVFNNGADSCSSTGSHLYRRTLSLSNGEVIWDFSGNVWEWVDWSNSTPGLQLGPVTCNGSWVDFPDVLSDPCYTNSELLSKEVFPATSSASSLEGFGKFIGGTGGAARRGGHFNDGNRVGAFALRLSNGTATSAVSIGFRCVYRP